MINQNTTYNNNSNELYEKYLRDEKQEVKEFKIPLEAPFDLVSEVDLCSFDVTHQEKLFHLAECALKEKRDFIFVLIKDENHGLHLFEATSFFKLRPIKNEEGVKEIVNPITKEPVLGGHLYIIYADQTLEEVKEHSAALLGNLEEAMDKENAHIHGLLYLSDPENVDEKKKKFELSLIVNLLSGTEKLYGNRQAAVRYAQHRAEENPFCKLFLSACYNLGIGANQDLKKGENLFAEAKAAISDATKLYRDFECRLKNLPKQTEDPRFKKGLAISESLDIAHTHRIFNPNSYA